ncbi:hypothetical protein BaRGS_00006087 [Batillaria attramentaria]|uniref:Uncharacterized protein n=1 Tax=Batillaria attramentaria TaxID=370345 RepID=A0ABD0LU67_9CAEN
MQIGSTRDCITRHTNSAGRYGIVKTRQVAGYKQVSHELVEFPIKANAMRGREVRRMILTHDVMLVSTSQLGRRRLPNQTAKMVTWLTHIHPTFVEQFLGSSLFMTCGRRPGLPTVSPWKSDSREARRNLKFTKRNLSPSDTRSAGTTVGD